MSVGTLLAGKSGTVVTIEPGAEVAAAVRSLLQHGIGGLPVVTAHGALVGLVAERDIVKALDDSGGTSLSFPVERIMRPPPTCHIDDPLHDVMWRMTRERLRHMVVLRGSHVAGVLSVGDLVKHRLEQLETEAGTLRDYVAAQRALR